MSFSKLLLLGLRQIWLRRTLMALLLILGSAFTLLDAYPVGHPPSEAVCQVLCQDECEHMPMVLTLQEDLLDRLNENHPASPLIQVLLEQAKEPEHTPPRRG